MVNIIICDDDIRFSKILEVFLVENLSTINRIEVLNSPFELIERVNEFDILFLGYEMPYMNGLEILEKIKLSSILKIMISNYNHISFNTYQYKLFWFIRKDHFEYDMNLLIPKFEEEMSINMQKFYLLSNNKYISISFNKINYIEKEINDLLIYTDEQTFKIRSSFSSILSQFDGLPFLVPTYGILVNIQFITYIDYHNSTILLNNDKIIAISRSKKEGVRKVYGKYNTLF